MPFHNTCVFKRLKTDIITFGRLIEMTFPSFELSTGNSKH